MNDMKTAPRDGSRILLKYCVVSHNYNNYLKHDGEKWEECRWMNDHPRPHWNPWCGRAEIRTTEHIVEENTLGWLPLPED